MKQERIAPVDEPASTQRSQVDHEYEIYPVSVAYKIHQSAFENSYCKYIGDGSFFDAKRT